jgi:dynein heavy chain
MYMERWPEEGYRQVGLIYLKQKDEDEDDLATMIGQSVEITQPDEIVTQSLRMHMDIIKSSAKFEKETGYEVKLTPVTFQNLLNTFKEIFQNRAKHYSDMKRKFETALKQFQETEDKIANVQNEMEIKSPLLVKQQHDIEDILLQLDNTTIEMEDRIKAVQEEQTAMNAVMMEQEKIKTECQKQFEDVIPKLTEAINSLQKLSKADITELKSIKKPTPAVYTLMQCVCIIMDVEKKQSKKPGPDGKYFIDWWLTAISSSVFGQNNLAEQLSNFDPESLTPAIIKDLLKCQQKNPDLNLENITKACVAARGLFQWLKAIEDYYYIYEACKPKRDAIILAEKQIEIHKAEIEERQKNLKLLQDSLTELRNAYKDKESYIKQIQTEIDTCQLLKTRAAKLLFALTGEKQKWMVMNGIIKQKFGTL